MRAVACMLVAVVIALAAISDSIRQLQDRSPCAIAPPPQAFAPSAAPIGIYSATPLNTLPAEQRTKF